MASASGSQRSYAARSSRGYAARSARMRRRNGGRGASGQLLLVTCIILTLALLTVSFISVQVGSKATELANSNPSIAQEWSTVREQFQHALVTISNQKAAQSATSFNKEAINYAFNEVASSMRALEARHGMSFDARLIGILNDQNPYSVQVELTLASENTKMTETLTVIVLFEFEEE